LIYIFISNYVFNLTDLLFSISEFGKKSRNNIPVPTSMNDESVECR